MVTYRLGQKVNPVVFLANYAKMCANKACFVIFECETRNITHRHIIFYRLVLNISLVDLTQR